MKCERNQIEIAQLILYLIWIESICIFYLLLAAAVDRQNVPDKSANAEREEFSPAPRPAKTTKSTFTSKYITIWFSLPT